MKLQELRASEGLTIRAIAEKCGIPPRSWEAWEYGRVNPSLESARKIIAAFPRKITLDELLLTARRS